MDNGSLDSLVLMRMPQGGYLVVDAPSPARDGYSREYRFASTTIDEALKFMRDKIKPVEPEQGRAGTSLQGAYRQAFSAGSQSIGTER